jgi:hypothetical protein
MDIRYDYQRSNLAAARFLSYHIQTHMSAFAPLKTRLRIDISGQRFERLTVIRPIGTRYKKVHWLCLCDCGRDTIVATGSLQSGHIRSCGCLYVDSRSTTNCTHRLSGTPEHRVWKGMITRCENQGRDFYPRYGGRGIKVCREWRESFPQFLADMGHRPSDRHTLERKDNDGDYEPSNCRWATMVEQGQNTSRTHRITFRGETLGANAWARRLRRAKRTIVELHRAGLPLDADRRHRT